MEAVAVKRCSSQKVLCILLLVCIVGLLLSFGVQAMASGLGIGSSDLLIQRSGVNDSFLLVGQAGVSDSWLYVGFGSPAAPGPTAPGPTVPLTIILAVYALVFILIAGLILLVLSAFGESSLLIATILSVVVILLGLGLVQIILTIVSSWTVGG